MVYFYIKFKRDRRYIEIVGGLEPIKYKRIIHQYEINLIYVESRWYHIVLNGRELFKEKYIEGFTLEKIVEKHNISTSTVG